MVIQVGKINNVGFKSSVAQISTESAVGAKNKNINELNYVTPDYNVNTPQKYKKLGVEKLDNGLEVHSYKLANGYRITIVPMEGSPTTVKNYVSVGSLNETEDIKGISHFLEHMAFNGTNGENGYIKLNTGDSFKKIDAIGGWTNASTSFAVTDYVNSAPGLEDKDLEEQIKVIAAMTEDLSLTDAMIEKEKGPVCQEINMIMDRPQTIAFDQNVRTLFGIKSSADELIAGSVNHIQNLTRADVKKYYDKYYTPNNMNLVITGEVNPDEVIQLVAKNFKSQKKSAEQKYEVPFHPINKPERKDFLTDKTSETHIVLGFAGPKNNNARATVLEDIVSNYLYSTNIGIDKELKKMGTSFFFDCQKVSTNPNGPKYLSLVTSCSDDNSEKVIKLFYDKLSNIKKPSEEQLKSIKESLLTDSENMFDHSEFVNYSIGNGILNGTTEHITNYKNILQSITADEVENYINQYLNLDKVAITVVHPDVKPEKIFANYNEASEISFKGTGRKPINNNKINEVTLDNNYKVGFFEAKNNHIHQHNQMLFEKNDLINEVVCMALTEIYDTGYEGVSEDDYKKYCEENNISVGIALDKKHLDVFNASSMDNYAKTLDLSQRILDNPKINEENLENVKRNLKDNLLRCDENSSDLFIDYLSKYSSNYTSKETLLEQIDELTVDDLKRAHEYIISNSMGISVVNIPESKPEFRQEVLNSLSKLNPVKPYEYKAKNVYVDNVQPAVLTKARPVSQADITQTYLFKKDMTLKEQATLNLMNSILRNSSIGLFDVLREKEHLAYMVSSSCSGNGNLGDLTCKILTTTDNKETGELTYDNVKKSINGFHRQIDCLINGEYTDEDLENAKRKYKAALLDNEGICLKLDIISDGIGSKEGVDRINQLYPMVDNITREDINEMAQKIFNQKPIYCVVASQDTLDANKDYLDSLLK